MKEANILIAESDAAVVTALVKSLTAWGGQTRCVSTHEELASSFQEQPADVLLVGFRQGGQASSASVVKNLQARFGA